MKHFIDCRKPAALMIALILVITCFGALADTGDSSPAAQSETVAKLLEVWDFKFFVREEGIGTGSCPVYTAPSEDSIRLSDGKASCNTADEIAVACYTDGWLMVRYEIKDKKARVGYIPPRYSRGLTANIGKDSFSAIQVRTAEAADITDNPRDNSTPFGRIPEGTEITILGKYTYTGNWWYVETTLNGQLTRGFIKRNKTAILVDGTVYHGYEELGYPVSSPENTAMIGTITVAGEADEALLVREHATRDSKMKARVYGGEIYPVYGTEEGPGGRAWYRIWVDGVWGWFASGNATLSE